MAVVLRGSSCIGLTLVRCEYDLLSERLDRLSRSPWVSPSIDTSHVISGLILHSSDMDSGSIPKWNRTKGVCDL